MCHNLTRSRCVCHEKRYLPATGGRLDSSGREPATLGRWPFL
jgi:hypothetical protein